MFLWTPSNLQKPNLTRKLNRIFQLNCSQ
jgi:hypothetical protein